MPIKKPNQYRPDYRALVLVRMTQEMMGSLEGKAGATYSRLLEEHVVSFQLWSRADTM